MNQGLIEMVKLNIKKIIETVDLFETDKLKKYSDAWIFFRYYF